MPNFDEIPPGLKWVSKEANRPRTQEEFEAGNKAALLQGSVADYMKARHDARKREKPGDAQ